MTTTLPSKLGDAELLSATASLVKTSRTVTAELVLHLAEVDARRLYLGRAFPSMFAWCTAGLGFSEDVACNLVAVARLARRLPATVDALRAGNVHLTGLRILAPHLTPENAHAVLADATGKSKRDIEELVARLAPQPPVPDSIRRLPRPAGNTTDDDTTASLFAGEPAPATTSPLAQAADGLPAPAPAVPLPPPTTPPRASMQPLSAETFKVQFTASRELRDKLREAQALLRHSVPDGDLAAVIECAIDRLITEVKKKHFGIGCQPRTRRVAQHDSTPETCPPTALAEGAPDRPAWPEDRSPSATVKPVSRHIPAAMRRAVYERDAGQCTFTDEAGRRCTERARLEFDHVDGFARTHAHSVEGLRLRCGPHNRYAAELLYGQEVVEAGRARRTTSPASAPGRMATRDTDRLPSHDS